MVSEKQKNNFEYFQNKIVTFFVPTINRNFDEKQAIDYFVGKVLMLDEMGIWYEHPTNKCRNFVFYDKIVMIAEEEVVVDSEVETPENLDETEKMNQELAKIDPENMAIEIQENPVVPQTIEDFRKFIS